MVCTAERQNDDLDAEDWSAGVARRTLASEAPAVRAGSRPTNKPKVAAPPSRTRAVTFRKGANAEMKDLVVTNQMLAQPQEAPPDTVLKYGVNVVNERALGKVGISPTSTWLFMSRHVSTRHDTFDVSSPCILAVSNLSNSAARHARLDTLDTSNVSCRARRDVT